jgi:hypothetical protein
MDLLASAVTPTHYTVTREDDYIVGGEDTFTEIFAGMEGVIVDSGLINRINREIATAESELAKCKKCARPELVSAVRQVDTNSHVKSIAEFDRWLSNFDKNISAIKLLWRASGQPGNRVAEKLKYLIDMRRLIKATAKL